MKKRVKIPESQAGKDVLCPICKDKLEKEWSNDAEGFVWINAVKGNGQVSVCNIRGVEADLYRSCTQHVRLKLARHCPHAN
jgi:hypothetical protein